jgi:hypothetical protein
MRCAQPDTLNDRACIVVEEQGCVGGKMSFDVLKLRKTAPQRLRSLGLTEVWLQQQILSDPSLLGLGELHVIQRERIQSSGGRLDFLMADFENETRFEIELMLGAVDESHIIRTIEYWDVERQRYPTLEHRAVIVAEEITSRFFNVIRLLNRAVPIMAIQLSAFKFDSEVILQFIKVLDTAEFAADPDDEVPVEAVNRSFWEAKKRPETLAIVDAMAALAPTSNGEPKITYNKTHIALGTSGYNFCWFHPRKVAWHCAVVTKVALEKRDAIIDSLEEAGLEAITHGRSGIRLNLKLSEIEPHKIALVELLRSAEEWSHR